MKTHHRLLLGLAAAACVAGLALAATGAPATTPTTASAVSVAATPAVTPLQAELAAVVAHLPGAKPGDVRTTPVAGLYEYRKGAQLLYVTADGRFGLAGDLYQLGDNTNLSDIRRRELRLALINAVPESSMVVFAPTTTPKYTITVFTDVDCGYCRALHRQISEYNRLGVKVRYLFFPRTGPNTESWEKAEKVWCSSDRRAALTQAKRDEPLKAAVCRPNPVAEQYALGQAIGLQGTPGIVTGSGDLLPGYAPPDALIEELKQDPHAADPPAG